MWSFCFSIWEPPLPFSLPPHFFSGKRKKKIKPAKRTKNALRALICNSSIIMQLWSLSSAIFPAAQNLPAALYHTLIPFTMWQMHVKNQQISEGIVSAPKLSVCGSLCWIHAKCWLKHAPHNTFQVFLSCHRKIFVNYCSANLRLAQDKTFTCLSGKNSTTVTKVRINLLLSQSLQTCLLPKHLQETH